MLERPVQHFVERHFQLQQRVDEGAVLLLVCDERRARREDPAVERLAEVRAAVHEACTHAYVRPTLSRRLGRGKCWLRCGPARAQQCYLPLRLCHIMLAQQQVPSHAAFEPRISALVQ